MEGNNNGGTWPSPQDRQNQDWKNTPAIGTGEGESPLMKQQTDVRTMSSDASSIQQTGGGAPHPYTPGSAPMGTKGSTPSEKNDQIVPPGIAVKDVGFTPPTPPVSPKGGSDSSPKGPDMPKKSGKGPFVAGLVFVVVVGLAAIGYFFVYPLFSNPPATDQQNATPPADSGEQNAPVIPVEPVVPVIPQENPTSTPVSVSTNEIHSSFFKTPADIVFDTKLTSFGINDLKQPLSFTPTSVPLMREIVWKSEDNKPLSFAQVAPTFLPTFFSPSITSSFDPDFTEFSYTDSSGTWLGFVAKLKDGITLAPVQDSMSAMQNDPDLVNLFLNDPGVVGTWKDGSVLNHATSEISFSKAGSTLSYTWFDRYLLVSTNLNAAKEAATRLGY